MLASEQVEELIEAIGSMNRSDLEAQFRDYRANFPLDFTADYLKRQSVDRLRHIFLAVCLQSKRMPELTAVAA